MNQKENGELSSIAKHVKILNEELGTVKINIEKIKTDVKWMMRIMIGIFVAVAIKVFI